MGITENNSVAVTVIAAMLAMFALIPAIFGFMIIAFSAFGYNSLISNGLATSFFIGGIAVIAGATVAINKAKVHYLS